MSPVAASDECCGSSLSLPFGGVGAGSGENEVFRAGRAAGSFLCMSIPELGRRQLAVLAGTIAIEW